MTRRKTHAGHKQASRSSRGVGGARSSAIPPAPAGTEASGTPAAAVQAEPEALVLSHWFDSGEGAEPWAATVRFTGSRAAVRGRRRDRDRFVHDETVDPVIPGTGPVAVTATVYGLEPGDWSVEAQLLPLSRANAGSAPRGNVVRPRAAPPAEWSWRRWRISTAPTSLVKTRWALTAPLARRPAVMPGAYPALAFIGGLLALALQAAILGRERLAPEPSLTAAVVAVVVGLAAAKAWYALLHPEESIIKGGWAVDGFLTVAPVAMVAALHALSQPMGVVLDATTPGVFFAVALGRIGCFVTGCCAGRSTRSRWGIWSSDRRVGARRIPAQLLESGAGLVLGITSLALVLEHALPIHGLVFVAGFAAYAAVRQILLRLRAEQRRSPRTIPLTAAAAAAVLVAVATMSTVERTEPPVTATAFSGVADDAGSPAHEGSLPAFIVVIGGHGT